MEIVKEQLKQNRPHLSASSLTTYCSIVKNLKKNLGCDDEKLIECLKDHNKVLKMLENDAINVRKTKLAVLVSLLKEGGAVDAYRKRMTDDAQNHAEVLKNQLKSKKQEENWLDWDNVEMIYNKLVKETTPLFRKQKLNKIEFMEVLKMVLLSLYVLLPPRRSKDFILMKFKNYQEAKDNFYDGKKFVFNIFKTAKQHGRQEVIVPPKLKLILKKWIPLIRENTDMLLVDYRFIGLTPSRLTGLMNEIFEDGAGKKISTSMLRTIFISDQFKGMPSLKQMERLGDAMGHNVSTQQEVYRKID